MYIAIVTFECFKTRLDVESFSSPFCYLASVLGVESEHKRRQSPLAWAGPMCSRAGATGETWAGRHGT
jgi:hypothetical protein